jgi:predicted O-linked N-acetylglucosamine transferase (SPINDLY family)
LPLPGAFCCYAPPLDAPPVTDLPAVRQGAVMFGALPKLEMLNDAVLDVSCAIRQSVPASRPLLCRRTLHGPTAEWLRRRFAERAVAAERPVLRRVEAMALAHLRVYDHIDIALDPFPSNGRGVRGAVDGGPSGGSARVDPFRTDDGKHPHGSRLGRIGRRQRGGDCRVAAELAGDVPRLAALRTALRQRLGASPLRDEPGLVRGLEAAYQSTWRRLCDAPAETRRGLSAAASA